jgi:hypothetical protein
MQELCLELWQALLTVPRSTVHVSMGPALWAGIAEAVLVRAAYPADLADLVRFAAHVCCCRASRPSPYPRFRHSFCLPRLKFTSCCDTLLSPRAVFVLLFVTILAMDSKLAPAAEISSSSTTSDVRLA